MRRRGGWGFAVLLLVSLSGWAQEQLGSTQPSARCSLSGTVYNAATSAGIGHALVSYSGPAIGFRFTDASGGFHVENLPAGQYSLSISKPGFISEEELSPSPIENSWGMDEGTPEQVSIAPSQKSVAIELTPESQPARIKLLPLSSITGSVLDENSVPLEGVSVQAIAVKTSLAGTDYAAVQSDSTDDRGHYLFLNLKPGDYIVRLAGEVSSTHYYIGKLNTNNDHRGMRPVYFPSGDSTSSASVFHLPPGEQANADFQQRTEAAFDINGRLVDFIPRVWTQMQMYRDGDRLPVARAFVNQSNGQFRVIDVPPGSYTLRALQFQTDPPKWLAAETPVSIASEPVSGLVVELRSGVDIPVSVAYEAGAKVDGRLFLVLQPQHTRQNARSLVTGRLTLPPGVAERLPQTGAHPELPPQQPSVLTNVIPDLYRLNVRAFGPDYVSSAKLGDQDILHREFSAGSNPGEIHIVVRGDGGTVEGQITAKGKAAPMAFISLVPAAGSAGAPLNAFADPAGHYEIPGVPPGDYRILAWTTQPTTAQLSAATGQTLTLQAGEHQTLSLEATENGSPPDYARGLQL